eukprot:5922078-Pleurochrysis_carterae.AAC.1
MEGEVAIPQGRMECRDDTHGQATAAVVRTVNSSPLASRVERIASGLLSDGVGPARAARVRTSASKVDSREHTGRSQLGASTRWRDERRKAKLCKRITVRKQCTQLDSQTNIKLKRNLLAAS